jgi:hypothetical protein
MMFVNGHTHDLHQNHTYTPNATGAGGTGGTCSNYDICGLINDDGNTTFLNTGCLAHLYSQCNGGECGFDVYPKGCTPPQSWFLGLNNNSNVGYLFSRNHSYNGDFEGYHTWDIAPSWNDGWGGYINLSTNFIAPFAAAGEEETIQFLSVNDEGNNSVFYDSTPTFNWTKISDTSQYHLEVDNNADFSSPEANYTDINQYLYPAYYSSNSTRVSFTLPTPLTSWGTYYFRVRAYTK